MIVKRTTLTPVAAAKMQKALEKAPHSLVQLATVGGLSKRLVTRYVRELQAAKMIHRGGWANDRRGYPTVEQYLWGHKPDVPCPLKQRTPAERMRDLRAKRKGEAK